ncbi:tyrosine phosphatase family-domain-containing protein [Naematelia encephala]|uniref:Putative tyrosine-protein phosphatase OCA1 n=1 Tax=Naematelia encephala TaxID=71784 RepID=A0A1Y2BHF2_9TREE|nr:tyrosine phosphatase family-domain-containing protein [Naematelia encephala]
MLTPPYHYSIVVCPSNSSDRDVLYRGSLPALRNLSFLARLDLRTIVYIRKKELKADDGLVGWAERRGVTLRWVKAEEMGEESLGMGRNEVLDVLKVILDTTNYPLYIADLDGISHTTLIVACLRKLQGWHQDSIINEICRFEPDHEDLPILPFINTFLSPPPSKPDSEPAFTLPAPPYPSWLWPTPTTSNPSSPSTKQLNKSVPTPTSTATQSNILPFAHPTTARRHPTMRITFPPLQTPTSPSAVPTPNNSGTQSPLSRNNSSRRGPLSPVLAPEENKPSLMEQASAVVQAITGEKALSGLGLVQPKAGRMVSFTGEDQPKVPQSPETTSPAQDSNESEFQPQVIEKDNGKVVVKPEDSVDETEIETEPETYDDEEEDEYEEDEDEDEDDDEDQQATSQYISALDLAGFG